MPGKRSLALLVLAGVPVRRTTLTTVIPMVLALRATSAEPWRFILLADWHSAEKYIQANKNPDWFAEAVNQDVANITEYFDTRFHSLLYQAAGNQKLVKILQDLHILMLRIWFHVGLEAIGFVHQAQNLYAVLEALEQKDPQKARAAMEDHVDQYAAQVKEKFL